MQLLDEVEKLVGQILGSKEGAFSACNRRAQKLTGENLKLVRAEFSTISLAIMMMCIYSSMWMHTHIYTWKLGLGFVLLAKVCPCCNVKNLFGIQDVYLQVLLTKLTPVIKTRLFLKLTNADKNRLAAFHTFDDKENCFRIWEMHEGVVDLDSFLLFPTAICWQLTGANCRPVCHNIFDLTIGSKPIIIIVNHNWVGGNQSIWDPYFPCGHLFLSRLMVLW